MTGSILDDLPAGREVVRRRRGVVEWIIFNRPAARNAITHAMEAELTAIFGGLNNEASVRAVVLTGAAGTKPAFMAGADMGDLQAATTPESSMHMEETSEAMLMALEAVHAPVIAAMARATPSAMRRSTGSTGSRSGWPFTRIALPTNSPRRGATGASADSACYRATGECATPSRHRTTSTHSSSAETTSRSLG
mgnify:CR=1 FL=1